MRLFVAVNFEEDVKNLLSESADLLKECCADGNFTRHENYHLTLSFIGETTKIGKIIDVLDSITEKSFEIKLDKIGKFKRAGGEIYWVGIRKNEKLMQLQKMIQRGLIRNEVHVERGEFRPHLTLAREVILHEDRVLPVLPCEGTVIHVNKVSLMKSDRENGKLVYSEIYAKKLEEI